MDGDRAQWRKDRLKALAAKMGGQAELGRRLGYRDGAYIGQMITGTRPITEKTIEACEALRTPAGEPLRGWFAQVGETVPSPPPSPGRTFREPTAEELKLLHDFRSMFDFDREEIGAEIAKRAERARRNFAQMGFKVPAPDPSE